MVRYGLRYLPQPLLAHSQTSQVQTPPLSQPQVFLAATFRAEQHEAFAEAGAANTTWAAALQPQSPHWQSAHEQFSPSQSGHLQSVQPHDCLLAACAAGRGPKRGSKNETEHNEQSSE